MKFVVDRNLRERRRMKGLNAAFYRLRNCVFPEQETGRVAKLRTLLGAVDRINSLQEQLQKADEMEAILTCMNHPTIEKILQNEMLDAEGQQ